MKRAMPLLLLLALSVLAACKDEPIGPSEGPVGEIRTARPPGAGPPPGGPQSGTISGRKFQDLDADGTDDGGTDPGLGGWTIQAYADVDKDGVRDTSELASGPVASAVTDTAGGYGLTVNPGWYTVCEVLEPGFTQSAPANSICAPDPGAAFGGYAVTVIARSSSTGMDFGNVQQQGTASGRKFHDLDADGVEDAGEPGLQFWVIDAYADTNGDGVLALDEFIAGFADRTETGADGNYVLTLDVGNYIVCEALGGQPGWTQSAPANTKCPASVGLGPGGHAVAITSGGNVAGNDFGNFQQGTASGRKFHDLDADGVEDAGEPGLQFWVIDAYADTNGDGVLDTGEFVAGFADRDETDANGDYELTLDPGQYVVCEVLQPGRTQSAPANTKCPASVGLGPGGHAVAITSGGDVAGNDFGNFEGSPPAVAEFQSISAGDRHTCGVTTGGDGYCWGGNGSGELGDGNAPTGSDTPVLVLGGHTFQSISAGDHHTCGVTTGGDAYCWGNNSDGQLGDGNVPTPSNTPVLVLGGHAFQSIDAGGIHTCGVTTGGDAYCWGRNTDGQLGDGNAEIDSDTPVLVLGGHTFQSISAGDRHTCGATTGGDAYCWGSNLFGQLGDGNGGGTGDSDTPVLVLGGHAFESTSAGDLHSCGVTTGGDVYCWGANGFGQLGGNPGTDSDTPVHVQAAHTFQAISAGGRHTCGVTTGEDAYCWGRNDEGELGDGNGGTGSGMLHPVLVVGGHAFQSISTGQAHTCGVSTDGDGYCWGNNSSGQLGDGNAPTNSDTPVAVVSP